MEPSEPSFASFVVGTHANFLSASVATAIFLPALNSLENAPR